MAGRKKKATAEKTATPKAEAPEHKVADTKVEHYKRQLRCPLTDAEKIERGGQVVKLLSDKSLKTADIKSATAHLKADVKRIEADLDKISKEVSEGACYRDVEIECRYIFRTGRVVEIRTDTGQEISERAMTGSERQLAPKALNEPPEKPANDEEAPDVPQTDEPPESTPVEDDDKDEGGAAAE